MESENQETLGTQTILPLTKTETYSLSYDIPRRRVRRNGVLVESDLTATEGAVFLKFRRNPSYPITYKSLYYSLHPDDHPVDNIPAFQKKYITGNIRPIMFRLRKKLAHIDPVLADCFETIPGKGYAYILPTDMKLNTPHRPRYSRNR